MDYFIALFGEIHFFGENVYFWGKKSEGEDADYRRHFRSLKKTLNMLSIINQSAAGTKVFNAFYYLNFKIYIYHKRKLSQLACL